MTPRDVILLGVPMDCGKRPQGCRMGPDAYRIAGIAPALAALGHRVSDRGTVTPGPAPEVSHPNPALFALGETVSWTVALAAAAEAAMADGFPIFMGGDHALSLGTVTGVAAHAAARQRPQFVLWLDAHSDIHTPDSTTSGHLHGTPVAYLSGRPGFGAFPPVAAPVPDRNICLYGIRSVDPQEHTTLAANDMMVCDMRVLDEEGAAAPLRRFLDAVRAEGGMLHVSLDVDFLDPSVAPGVITTVPGGATFREAHLVMELLGDSGLVTSLDLVELNPFVDDRGRTAQLMVDLVASLLGRRVFDRPTRAWGA
jgi:arginase